MDRVIALLSHDLAVTLGHKRAEALATEHARASARNPDFDREECTRLDGYARRITEDVQQFLHDDRIDTTWPACPIHGHHPLWLEDGEVPLTWHCPTSGTAVALLGQLAPSPR